MENGLNNILSKILQLNNSTNVLDICTRKASPTQKFCICKWNHSKIHFNFYMENLISTRIYSLIKNEIHIHYCALYSSITPITNIAKKKYYIKFAWKRRNEKEICSNWILWILESQTAYHLSLYPFKYAIIPISRHGRVEAVEVSKYILDYIWSAAHIHIKSTTNVPRAYTVTYNPDSIFSS